jgi:hypothetical protein
MATLSVRAKGRKFRPASSSVYRFDSTTNAPDTSTPAPYADATVAYPGADMSQTPDMSQAPPAPTDAWKPLGPAPSIDQYATTPDQDPGIWSYLAAAKRAGPPSPAKIDLGGAALNVLGAIESAKDAKVKQQQAGEMLRYQDAWKRQEFEAGQRKEHEMEMYRQQMADTAGSRADTAANAVDVRDALGQAMNEIRGRNAGTAAQREADLAAHQRDWMSVQQELLNVKRDKQEQGRQPRYTFIPSPDGSVRAVNPNDPNDNFPLLDEKGQPVKKMAPFGATAQQDPVMQKRLALEASARLSALRQNKGTPLTEAQEGAVRTQGGAFAAGAKRAAGQMPDQKKVAAMAAAQVPAPVASAAPVSGPVNTPHPLDGTVKWVIMNGQKTKLVLSGGQWTPASP